MGGSSWSCPLCMDPVSTLHPPDRTDTPTPYKLSPLPSEWSGECLHSLCGTSWSSHCCIQQQPLKQLNYHWRFFFSDCFLCSIESTLSVRKHQETNLFLLHAEIWNANDKIILTMISVYSLWCHMDLNGIKNCL